MIYIWQNDTNPWIYKQEILSESAHSMSLRRLDSTKLQMPLEELLSTKDGFDLFANQLVKEFSIENLFFVYEVMQTKRDAIDHNLVESEEVGLFMEMDYGIVRRQDSSVYNVEDLNKNLRHITEQYIMQSGEFCVNISAMTKLQCINALQKNNTNTKDVGEMIEVFDAALKEVLALMKTDSIARFYNTQEYKVMITNMNYSRDLDSP